MTVTYPSYLHLDQLLSIQQEQSEPAEHDELLFIIIHQAYELWFKQQLHETGLLTKRLEAGDTFGSIRTMRRMLVILKLLVAQTDVIETMTPTSFNRFRDYLDTASGFQSFQFREVEYAFGAKNDRFLSAHPEGSEARTRLEAKLAAPTVFDSFVRYLISRGHDVPAAVRDRDVTKLVEPDEEFQHTLRDIYLKDPEAVLIIELCVDFDEGFQEFRYRHVKMVERTIGDKTGTGGSSGVDYLRSTLFRPFFPDLWRFRSLL